MVAEARGQLYFDPVAVLRETVARLAPQPAEREVVRRFEREFASAHEAPFAVALPHARLGLHYLLQILALPAGSQVVMTPLTIPQIVNDRGIGRCSSTR